jgi:hypothetical protein
MRPKKGACHITDMVRAQKLNGIMKNSKRSTYTKSYHSQLPRAVGGLPLFLPRTPRTFGCGPQPLVLLAAGAGFVPSALLVVVVSLGAATSVAAKESAIPEKAVAPHPVSSLAAGAAVEVVQLSSASPSPPSSGAWGPAPR